MTRSSFQIIAPGIKNCDFVDGLQTTNPFWSEAEILGSAVWLWMHSQKHKDLMIKELPSLLLPAIKHQQFILISENNKPIFYLSWANFSAEVETKYINNIPYADPVEDWNSGDRVWIIDWLAPFGHTAEMTRLITSSLFANYCFRSLYHRGNERGLRIKTFHGSGVTKHDAQYWFATHPISLDSLPLDADLAHSNK